MHDTNCTCQYSKLWRATIRRYQDTKEDSDRLYIIMKTECELNTIVVFIKLNLTTLKRKGEKGDIIQIYKIIAWTFRCKD